jgi:hypothetical protein
MVTDTPRAWLRLEGLAVLALSVVLYARTDQSWWWFVLLFLVPDLSMLGYLRGPQLGAMSYNIAHTYAFPVLLGVVGLLSAQAWIVGLALIWVAHIGFDRMVGYGLKYRDGFAHTHLGMIGRGRRS